MKGFKQIWDFWTEYLINEQLAKIIVLIIRNKIDKIYRPKFWGQKILYRYIWFESL